MTTYREKLLDPRWQRKRLEILQRDNFTCTKCGATEKTLHVHHGYYEAGCDPWEYNSFSLSTLCVDCHVEVGEILKRIHADIAWIPADEIDVMEEIVSELLLMFLTKKEARGEALWHSLLPKLESWVGVCIQRPDGATE